MTGAKPGGGGMGAQRGKELRCSGELSPQEKIEQAKAHEQKLAKFAVPLTKLIEQRELSKARRVETIRGLLEQAHQKGGC